MKRFGLLEIKQSLRNDQNFRNLFPEYAQEISAFLDDPSCSCHATLYRRIAEHRDRLEQYQNAHSGAIAVSYSPSRFQVVNCGIDELEDKLRSLGRQPVHVALARYQEQVTVILMFA